jgi:uncharacterized protein involved in exopolysaccharide biosynthesis/Mrp family chromosome partitioning ATPase
MYQDDQNYGSIDEAVELRAIWHGLQRRFGVFSVVFLITFLSVAIYAFTAQRLYTAETSMVIESRTENLVGTGDVLSNTAALPREIETEIELLRSRAMAMRVIRRLQSEFGDSVFGDGAPSLSIRQPAAGDESLIEESPFSLEEFGLGSPQPAGDEALPPPAPEQDGEIQASSSPGNSSSESFAIEDAIPTLMTSEPSEPDAFTGNVGDFIMPTGLINQVLNRLQVDRVGTTYLVRIRYSAPSVQNAALIANAFADEYIQEQLEAKFEALRQTSQWIDARLNVLREEVRASEETASKFRAEFGLIDNEGTNANERRISQLATELATARTELSAAIARYDSVNRTLQRSEPIETINEVMSSPIIREMRRQQAEVLRRRGELRARYGELHPEMKQVNQELEDLGQEIEIEISRIIENLKREVNYAEIRVNRITADLTELQKEIATENPTFVRLRELERDTLASRELYEALLDRQKELNELERLAQPNARIITRASPPDSPSRPQTTLLFAAGGALAILLASVSAFIAEAADTRIASSADLRRSFGSSVPVVLVPKVQRRKVFRDQELGELTDTYIREKPSSTFADAFREMRMHLMMAKNADQKEAPISIAFASSFRDEGATTAAFSFATLLASEGERVVFVDADVYARRDESIFNDRKPGLFHDSFKLITDARKKERTKEGPAFEFYHEGEEPAGELPADEQGGGKELMENRDAGGGDATLIGIGPAADTGVTLFKTVNDVDIVMLSENRGVATEEADGVSIDGLLSRLSGMYDYIVIDSSAILEKADASYIASRADYVSLLTEWRVTTRDALMTACRSLIDVHANFLCFVINKVDERRRHFFRPEDRKFYFSRKLS